jgi:class 3 adenylate cyclase
MAALEGAFEFDPVGPLTLKGLSNPVPAFALKG